MNGGARALEIMITDYYRPVSSLRALIVVIESARLSGRQVGAQHIVMVVGAFNWRTGHAQVFIWLLHHRLDR